MSPALEQFCQVADTLRANELELVRLRAELEKVTKERDGYLLHLVAVQEARMRGEPLEAVAPLVPPQRRPGAAAQKD